MVTQNQIKYEEPSIFISLVMGGLAGILTVSVMHPMHVLKTRMQLSGNPNSIQKDYSGIYGAIKSIYQEQGLKTFYKGIQAAWIREAMYTSAKIGLFEHIQKLITKEGAHPTIFKNFISGAVTGAIGSLISNPSEVLKTVMMADENKLQSLQYYIKMIYKNNGLKGFYRGLDSNISRAVVLNSTKLGVYTSSKQFVKQHFHLQEGALLIFYCSFIAGFFMACTTTPFDMFRTRLMNQTSKEKVYSGLIDCIQKIIRQEGFRAVYKGFVPLWAKFAPTSCLQFLIFEELRHKMGYKHL